MPLFQYFFGVGGILLCLLFVADVYVPKLPPRPGHEIDKSTIRITAPKPTGDFVLNTYPPIGPDPLSAPPTMSEASIREALAKMEPETKPKRPVRKKAVASRPAASRLARNDAYYGPEQQAQAWSRQAWSNSPNFGRWSPNPWSSNPWRSNSWSNGW